MKRLRQVGRFGTSPGRSLGDRATDRDTEITDGGDTSLEQRQEPIDIKRLRGGKQEGRDIGG